MPGWQGKYFFIFASAQHSYSACKASAAIMAIFHGLLKSMPRENIAPTLTKGRHNFIQFQRRNFFFSHTEACPLPGMFWTAVRERERGEKLRK
jgi:hypothetical protein